MTVVIMGGAGFIGSKILELYANDDVHIFDNLSAIVHTNESINEFLERGAALTVGDVRNADEVHEFLDAVRPTVLVYLAAETGTGRSLYNLRLNSGVNVMGLSNVLDSLSRLEHKPDRIVFSATRAVYGEGPYQNAVGEIVYPQMRSEQQLAKGQFEFEGLKPLAMNAALHHPNPSNIYGSTKLCQEHLLKNWCDAFAVPLYTFRLQNVYGAGQSLSNPYTGVLIHFLRCAHNKSAIPIYENGNITRDFVHVDDVARLLICAIDGQGTAGTYDCGSGERVALETVAAEISDIANSVPPVMVGTYRLGDVRHASADITNTLAHFDWTPNIDRIDALQALYTFFLSKEHGAGTC